MNLARLFLILSVVAGFTTPFLGGQEAAEHASENYVITPLDLLKFRVIGENETMTEVRVAADNSVTLPYIGTVELGGKTVQAARQYLYEIYDRDWYVNPQIDLLVLSYSQRRVQVLGKVARQGFVIFPPEEELTLLQAISGAGGWSPDNLANKKEVELKRVKPDGTTEITVINAEKIGPNDHSLKDGDIIIVPERRF